MAGIKKRRDAVKDCDNGPRILELYAYSLPKDSKEKAEALKDWGLSNDPICDITDDCPKNEDYNDDE